MHVAVCVVGFRNPGDILTCLEALKASEHADFEVIICENGGPAAYAELTRAAPAALPGGQRVQIVLAESNLGYAGGINVCMRGTPEADAWWILNPDAAPAAPALARLCARLARGDCGAVGCTVHYADGVVESRGGQWRPWLARAVSIDHSKQLADPPGEAAVREQVTYISGASMLVGRALVDRIGLMREDYFLYAEEVEWCLRAVQAGLKLGLAIDANVVHAQGATTGSVKDVAQRRRMPVYLDERNKMLVTRDRFPGRLPVAAVAALILLFLRFGRRRAWAQLGYAVDGWWAGLRNLRGKPAWVDAG